MLSWGRDCMFVCLDVLCSTSIWTLCCCWFIYIYIYPSFTSHFHGSCSLILMNFHTPFDVDLAFSVLLSFVFFHSNSLCRCDSFLFSPSFFCLFFNYFFNYLFICFVVCCQWRLLEWKKKRFMMYPSQHFPLLINFSMSCKISHKHTIMLLHLFYLQKFTSPIGGGWIKSWSEVGRSISHWLGRVVHCKSLHERRRRSRRREPMKPLHECMMNSLWRIFIIAINTWSHISTTLNEANPCLWGDTQRLLIASQRVCNQRGEVWWTKAKILNDNGGGA